MKPTPQTIDHSATIVPLNPTEADIGRQVIYHGWAGERESGVITSFNDSFVFVRYGMGCTSAATAREQLSWAVQS